MSLELTPVLICDTCGRRYEGKLEHRFTRAAECAWRTRMSAEDDGWQTFSRGRYHTEAHICPNCIDKPMPTIKSGKRKKKPKPPICPPLGLGDDPTKAAEYWKEEKDSGDEWKDKS